MRWFALVVVAGCTSEAPVGPDEPRTWDGDFLVDRVLVTCDEVSWTYDVWTLGWGEEVTVDFVGRNPDHSVAIREHHSLPEVDYDDTTSHHQLELDQAYAYDEYVSGETTRLACPDKTFVTYGFAAWSYAGDMTCVAWGIDPAGDFPQCEDWGEDGHSIP
jgi:hypothetical protein